MAVDRGREARRDHGRRVVLLDDRRPGEAVAGAQPLALVERRAVALRPARDLEDHLAVERLRSRTGSPSPASSSVGLQLVDAADADGADVDDLDRRVEAVAVLELVRGVEARLQLLDPGVVDVAGGHLGAHLVALPGVAAVGQAPHEAAILGDRVGVELRDGLAGELVEARRELRLVEALERVALGGDELVLEIGREQAGGGEDAGVRRHEHARDLELERDVAGEQRPGAARGDERELARVVAAPHGVELDRLGHPVLLDLQCAERRLLDRHPELAGDVLMAVSASSRSSCIAPPSRPRSERRRPSRSCASVEVGSVPPRP